MKCLLLSATIVTCACSIASADNFSFYGRGGYAVQGYTTPNFTGGFRGYGYDTHGHSFNFNYQPSFPMLPAYDYYPSSNYYRAPVLNDYYQMNSGRGYGYKAGPGGY